MKPSKAIEAVVYEFGIRWPCPRDVDPDRYDARLRDLMRLCAGMAPGLLRKAGDRIAVVPGRPFTLPSAGELHEAADAIMADRAAKQEAANRVETPHSQQHAVGDKEAAYYRINGSTLANDKPFMFTASGDMFKLGDIGERRGVRGDGSVIEPWFHHATGPSDPVIPGWYCLREDARDLAACYDRWGSNYTLDGAMIVERDRWLGKGPPTAAEIEEMNAWGYPMGFEWDGRNMSRKLAEWA